MTNTTIENSLKDLNRLILNGTAMEGFEKYYDNNVVMQENEMTPTIGKDANRQRELHFFNSITEFRDAKVLGHAIGENMSFVTWHFDYTHKDWGVRKYTQVSVQTWKDGKIVKEQFFYGT
jgi:hypothetical protein